MDTYVYEIDNVDYINLTNKCTNSCVFCIRNNREGMSGCNLWLEKEPEAEDIISLLEINKRDVVFCGFGEPMIKIDVLKKVAAYVKSYGGNVRVNTNGHADKFHGRVTSDELIGLVDTFSISLNNYDADSYNKICNSIYGPEGYNYMIDFVRHCISNGFHVVLTALDIIGKENIEKCRIIAENLGAEFRERFYY